MRRRSLALCCALRLAARKQALRRLPSQAALELRHLLAADPRSARLGLELRF